MPDYNQHLDIQATLRRLDGDQQLLKELYAAYAKDMPNKLAALAAAMEQHDSRQLGRVAHSLKGAASAIGANRSRELAERIEIAAESGELDDIKILLPHFSAEVEIVLKEMDRV